MLSLHFLVASTENGFVAEPWVRATIASVDAITSLHACYFCNFKKHDWKLLFGG
jgi:hypothetical protein